MPPSPDAPRRRQPAFFQKNPRAGGMQDEEGISTMRQLARNMAYFLKCIEAGREKGLEHEVEPKARTNFIR